jgi:Low affinity iron permease
MNTISSVVTFLMAFLIQNTQNRDSVALQLKLDELIRATTRAQNDLIGIEDESQPELDEAKRREESGKSASEQKRPRAKSRGRPHQSLRSDGCARWASVNCRTESGDIVPLGIQPAHFICNFHGHIAGPSLSGVERNDADWIAVLAREQIADYGLAVCGIGVGLAPR